MPGVSTKNKLLQDAAVATGNGELLDTVQLSGVGFQVLGTFVGTVTFEGTVDSSNWVAIQVKNKLNSSTTTTANAPGIFVCATSGLAQVRARVSAWTSGSITVEGMTAIGGENTIGEVDAATGVLAAISYEHHVIHFGSHYFVQGYQDLSLNNVLDFTWQMPNTTKWIHWTWHISTESETLWQIYEPVVATNPLANAITPYNSNRNSANTSGTTMKYELQTNLAAANSDTNVTGGTLIAHGVSGAGKDSGIAQRDNEIIMKQNTLYCLRATATTAGNISFDMQWYEHTSKE